MSILHCALIHNKQKRKLAESSEGKIFEMQIYNKLPQIFNGNVYDCIEFENYYLTYTRSKEIIYLCISPMRFGSDKARAFIETVINKFNNQEYDISKEPELSEINIRELSLQSKLGVKINKLIENYNTGIEDISKKKIENIKNDVEETKQELNKYTKNMTRNINNLNDELLGVSENVKNKSNAFRKDAKILEGETRCCKPANLKIFIILGVILLSLGIYTIISFSRCESFNAFC